MFLDYFALVMLIIGISLVIYTFIYIHDIPYQIAKKRDHEQKEAIHLACWLSLFTLHALWPLVFMWSVAHKKGQAERIVVSTEGKPDLAARIAELEARIKSLEATGK